MKYFVCLVSACAMLALGPVTAAASAPKGPKDQPVYVCLDKVGKNYPSLFRCVRNRVGPGRPEVACIKNNRPNRRGTGYRNFRACMIRKAPTADKLSNIFYKCAQSSPARGGVGYKNFRDCVRDAVGAL
ncbi:hypothetical protein [Nocardia panacis]|uniref:hypothetical protein n=1 Tax=Nocardia panacis TaxID=2340916 RepID=UPI0011C45A19|nr:hypothetical protein [Nocardia panacis]